MSCGVLSYGFCEIAGIRFVSEFYGLFAFSGTFTIYNFQRIVKYRSASNNSQHLQWVGENLGNLTVLTAISAISTGILSILLVNWNLATIIVGAIVLLVSVFYVVKIGNKNLRDLPFLKIHLISIIWVISFAVFPLVNEQIYSSDLWFFGLSHYFYILAICIPFDIRDLPHDKPEQRTIPQIIGVQSSKMVGILLLIVFTIIAVYFVTDLGQNKLFIIAIMAQALLIYFTSRNQDDIYYGGFIDGAISILGISYLI